MLSIDRCKQLLSVKSALNDSELLELREALSLLAQVAIDAYLTNRTQSAESDVPLNAAQLKPRASFRGELLTRGGLAQELGVSCRTVDRWHALRTDPPRVKIGKTVYYRREAVVEWIARNEVKALSRRRV